MKLNARIRMAALGFVIATAIPVAAADGNPPHQATAAGGAAATNVIATQKKVETYLRNLYALGSDTTVKVAVPKDIGVEGILEVDVDVTMGENSQSGKVYVSRDGKYIIRGEVAELAKDPATDVRAKLQIKDAPSIGDPKAPVTLVEFSDFECPVCKNLHDGLRGLLPNYPQVRLVFKNFPLEQIHPWARTAALAGQCAFQADPKAFWKMYDLIYDNQSIISAENAWTKLLEYGGQAGVGQDQLKACMASPEASTAVNASHDNGVQLEVGSTPTIFVNGRRIVGSDARVIEQYIKYELDQRKTSAKN